jgi:peptidoglycan/LPS O-acetylase OafA/YrhL
MTQTPPSVRTVGDQFGMVHKDDSYWLDVLRGQSALIVLFVHIYQECMRASFPVPSAVSTGLIFSARFSVYVFFVLSGFMVWGSILRQTSTKPFEPGPFCKARLVRLYPPLIFTLLLAVVVYLILTGLGHDPDSFIRTDPPANPQSFWVSLLGNLFFLQGMGVGVNVISILQPLWSLSYEFWFYVMAMGAAVVLFKPGWRVIASILLIILTVGLALLVSPRFFFGLLVWTAGATMMWGYSRTRGELLNRYSTVWISLFIGIVMAAFTVYLARVAKVELTWAQLPAYFAAAAVIAAFVVLSKRIFPKRLRFFDWIAESALFSYTLYIIHYPILVFATVVISPKIAHWGLAVNCIVFLAMGVLIIVLSKFIARYLEDKKFVLSLFKPRASQSA